MNKKFKFLTVLLALVMTLGAFAPFSARAEEVKETKTVTLHKILMTKSNLNSENARKVTVEYTNKDGKKESKEFVIIKKDENNYELAAQSKVEKDKIANIDATINEKLKNENLKDLYNGQDAKVVFEGHIGLDGTSYNGNAIDQITQYFGDKAEPISGVYFALKFADGPNAGKYVQKDDTDNLKPAVPLTATENIDKAVGGLTTKAGVEFKTAGLKGNFEIDEIHDKSTYKGTVEIKDDKGNKTTVNTQLTDMKAVPVKITLPLVNEEGVVEHAHVYPKNIEDKPQIDKNFLKGHGLTKVEDVNGIIDAGADYENYQKEKATVTAEIGREIPYEVKTQLPKNAKYKTLRWSDRMTPGLTFKKDSLKITLKRGTTELKFDAIDYKVSSNDRGFDLEFTKTGLEKLQKELETDSIEITLEYKATVNKDALIDVPEKNDIKLFYGNNKSFENEPTEVKPKENKIEVKKSWDITGDQTVTDADKNAVVTYTLQIRDKETNEWKDVNDPKIQNPVIKKYDSANPQGSFNHTFEGLKDDATYRVLEEVTGYEPEYLITNEDGTVSITNHKKTDNPKPLNPTEPKVVLGGKRFVKTNDEAKDSKELKRLAGAEFYVKNAKNEYLVAAKKDASKVTAAKKALDEAVENYNKLSAEEQKGTKGEELKNIINAKQGEYNKAFKENATKYTWGKKDDANVVVLTSDGEGRFEITGLEYGSYKLEEKTAPKGFAKKTELVDFKVEKDSYKGSSTELKYNPNDTDGDEKTVYGKQITNKKVTIPETGGIGTVIFTVVGVMLMVGAAFALKRRKEDELEGLA